MPPPSRSMTSSFAPSTYRFTLCRAVPRIAASASLSAVYQSTRHATCKNRVLRLSNAADSQAVLRVYIIISVPDLLSPAIPWPDARAAGGLNSKEIIFGCFFAYTCLLTAGMLPPPGQWKSLLEGASMDCNPYGNMGM